jgi:hypothetical protein
MTPKEKAWELIIKFSQHVSTWDYYWDTPRDEQEVINDAKECALIAVGEILKMGWNLPHYDKVTGLEYWQEVESEIELL